MDMMKPGDWNCPACGDLQFARNTQCRKCGTLNPDPTAQASAGMMGGFGGAAQPQREGDWSCPSCGDLQFARNMVCRKCGTPNPVGGGGGGPAQFQQGAMPVAQFQQGAMPGDWSCPACGDLQFARNTACRKCGTPNPHGAGGGFGKGFAGAGACGGKGGFMKPGDWLCPNCNDLQFGKNKECRKCGTPNPGTAIGQKAGDWFCPSCGDFQFAKNAACRQCGTQNPDPAGSAAAAEAAFGNHASKPGDWTCPSCGDLQFARNTNCRKCQAPNPDPQASALAVAAAGPKFQPSPGDWYCSACGDLQFARNMQCRKCGAPNVMGAAQMMMGLAGGCGGCAPGGFQAKPMIVGQAAKGGVFGGKMNVGGKGAAAGGMPMGGMPGDWNCPACGDHQFARNTACRKCGTPNPQTGAQGNAWAGQGQAFAPY